MSKSKTQFAIEDPRAPVIFGLLTLALAVIIGLAHYLLVIQ